MKSVTALFCVLSVPVLAQVALFHPETPQPAPAYEVATIKPIGPTGVPRDLPRTDATHKISTVRGFIAQAYGAPPNAGRVLGVPQWLDHELYSINVTLPADALPAEQAMSRDRHEQQDRLRLQSLLRDRFKLKVHFEQRELPVYELTIAKGAPKVTPSNEADPEPKGVFAGPGKGPLGLAMKAHAVTLEEAFQQPYLGLDGRPVVDKTGLKGKFDFSLEWTISAQNYRPPPGSEAPPPVMDGPTIFTAVQEQLGLKLVPAKDPVEVLVIDGIERPSEN